jgi:hypothetical protein
MSTLIKNLHIKNFKSVRDLSLECDRINIFIGKPNAGKSNILEAISLLGAEYSKGKFMEGFIRYKSIVQLFYNFNYNNRIDIIADTNVARLISSSKQGGSFNFNILNNQTPVTRSLQQKSLIRALPIPQVNQQFNLDGYFDKRLTSHNPSPIKKYMFNMLGDYQEKDLFLHPPHGENFYLIVRSNPKIKEEIQRFLKPNGLELLLDEESQRIVIVKKEDDSLISFPLHLVPDTFQRYIFHLAAIMSNRRSVLLFEEPESHSYPPYIYQLAQYILDDEGKNQFFITTHSPYFLTPLMQEGKDVAVFATWFEDYQTHARRLSGDEISEMLNYGVDIFLNLDHFTQA